MGQYYECQNLQCGFCVPIYAFSGKCPTCGTNEILLRNAPVPDDQVEPQPDITLTLDRGVEIIPAEPIRTKINFREFF